VINLKIKTLEDLKKSKVIWTGGWFLDTFTLTQLIKVRENKRSIHFEGKEEWYRLTIGENTVKIIDSGIAELTSTRKVEDILYGKIPYFTTREETINHFIERTNEEIEEAKEKIIQLPRIVEFLNKLKKGDKNGN